MALVVAGCSPTPKHQSSADPTSGPAATSDPAASGAPSAELERFYTQRLEWKECEQGECATAIVPVDYADPAGPTTSLALARSRASGDRIGSLLINPGGPGGSGFDFLESALDTVRLCPSGPGIPYASVW